MNFIQKSGSAKTSKEINIRQGQPSTTSLVGNKISTGQIIKFIGFVTDGENVKGNMKWFKTKDGNYFWSGNVEVLSDVVPETPTIPNIYNVITAIQLTTIIPALKTMADEYVIYLNNAMKEFSITTPLRQSAFIAQTAHESQGYGALIENLNYSAENLIKTWPTRFNKDNAPLYARQAQKIANKVYSGRYGNGDEASGDGCKYRGRGIIQITFKDNYRACGVGLNLDLVKSPELLEQKANAFRSGAWFWNSRNLNPLADVGDFTKITKIINGGIIGLDERIAYYNKVKLVLGV